MFWDDSKDVFKQAKKDENMYMHQWKAYQEVFSYFHYVHPQTLFGSLLFSEVGPSGTTHE
jgi:hypothetical protein